MSMIIVMLNYIPIHSDIVVYLLININENMNIYINILPTPMLIQKMINQLWYYVVPVTMHTHFFVAKGTSSIHVSEWSSFYPWYMILWRINQLAWKIIFSMLYGITYW